MNIFQILQHNSTVQQPQISLQNNLLGEKILSGHITANRNCSTKRLSSVCFEHLKSALNSRERPYYFSQKSFNEHLVRLKDTKRVIYLNNKYKIAFDTFMDFLIWYSVLTSLAYLSFINISAHQRDFDIFISIMFIIDLILTFFTEFRNKKNQRVRNLRLIFLNYIQGWLIFDIASLLPLSLVNSSNSEYFLRFFRIFKMNRLVNRINIEKISEKISTVLNPETTRKKKTIKIVVVMLWDLFKELGRMLFVSYFLACIWYYYVGLIIRREHPSQNFFTYFGLDDISNSNKFIIIWYFIFSTIMTVGYGDYSAIANKFEMGFCIIILLVGPTWFAFTMGKAIHILNEIYEVWGKKDKIGRVKIWLSIIEKNYKEMPVELKEKIVLHFLHYFKNDRLGSLANLTMENEKFSYKINDIYFLSVSHELKIKILAYLFEDVFNPYFFFFNIFKPIQYDLALFLEPRIFEKNEIILGNGQMAKEIFFKTKGFFQIGIKNTKSFQSLFNVHSTFIVGDYFALKKIPSFADFYTANIVFGYALPEFALKKLVKNFKHLKNDYLERIKYIYEGINKEIENLCSTNVDSEENDPFLDSEKRKNSNLVNSGNENGLKVKPTEYEEKYRKTTDVIEENQEKIEKNDTTWKVYGKKKDRISEDINRIKIGIDKLKELKKNKISLLKEKLANHIFSLTNK